MVEIFGKKYFDEKKRAKMHSFPKNVIKIKMQKNSLLYKMI
jgi:hypothetical protein